MAAGGSLSQWSPQQDAALLSVRRWLEAGAASPQVYRLFGFAGTGKTTLAKELASGVSGRVVFCAFTGKAAHVLRQKGCPEASTVHSLIYNPSPKSQTTLSALEADLLKLLPTLPPPQTDPFGDPIPQDPLPHIPPGPVSPQIARLRREILAEREKLAQPAFAKRLHEQSGLVGVVLIVVDEGSMIDERVGADLLSFGIKILVLGDPAQLPPPRGAAFFTRGDPDFLLTEIHRQALDSPVLQLATMVRERRHPKLGQYGTSRVMMKHELTPQQVIAADQVLVGRNATRESVNLRCREVLGLGPGRAALAAEPRGRHALPVVGDKLVCLRNDHEIGLLNGSLWRVEDVGVIDGSRMGMHLKSTDSTDAQYVDALTEPFYSGDVYKQKMRYWERADSQEFYFGYGLTVHKSQGSQWDNVLVLDESSMQGAAWHRHLYTAITRAAESVTVVKGY